MKLSKNKFNKFFKENKRNYAGVNAKETDFTAHGMYPTRILWPPVSKSLIIAGKLKRHTIEMTHTRKVLYLRAA